MPLRESLTTRGRPLEATGNARTTTPDGDGPSSEHQQQVASPLEQPPQQPCLLYRSSGSTSAPSLEMSNLLPLRGRVRIGVRVRPANRCTIYALHFDGRGPSVGTSVFLRPRMASRGSAVNVVLRFGSGAAALRSDRRRPDGWLTSGLKNVFELIHTQTLQAYFPCTQWHSQAITVHHGVVLAPKGLVCDIAVVRRRSECQYSWLFPR